MRQKHLSLEKRQRRVGYLFLLPFAVGALFFILYPILLSLRFSVSEVIPTVTGYTLRFVGKENFRYLFQKDPKFVRTLVETLRTMLLSVPIVLVFSFFIASLLDQEFVGRSLARAILFLPLIVSSGAVSRLMASDTLGSTIAEKGTSSGTELSTAFVAFLEQFKISDTVTGVLVSAIENIGTVLAMSAIPIVIFLAGLRSISPSIYEASYVEGATKWEVFWKISLPMISPLVLVVILYCVIDQFTRADNAVLQNVWDICFNEVRFGRGSAMAWVYLAIVLAILTVVYLIVDRFVFYND